jgi:hypothetical protein
MRWSRQPDGPVKAAAGVSALWSGARWADAVSGRPVGLALTSVAGAVTRMGRALRVSGTGTLNRAILRCASGADTPGARDFTAIALFRLDSTAGGYAAIGRWNTGASPSTCDWYIGADGTFGGTTTDFAVAAGSTIYKATVSAGWVAGATYLLIGRRRGTTILLDRLSLDDRIASSASTTNAGITTINSHSARQLKIGEIDAGASLNADLSLIMGALVPRAITDAEVAELQRNPWLLAERVEDEPDDAAPSGYTLTADAGSYALTGQAAGLLAQRVLAAEQGSYALTGAAAGLLAARTLAADQGSYALTGQPASLVASRAVQAGQGSYTLTGQSAALLVQRMLAAAQGAYTLSGQDAALVYTPVGAYTLSAAGGSYALTGQSAGLAVARAFTAGQGSYTLTGHDVTLLRSTPIVCDSGAYSLTGQTATLLRTVVMTAQGGVFTLTGQAATLTWSGAGSSTFTAQSRLRVGATALTTATRRVGASTLTTPTPRIGSIKL